MNEENKMDWLILNKFTLYRRVLMSLLLIIGQCSLMAEDWSMFRGSSGNGISAESKVPISWNAEKNVKWKVSLSDKGNGSPIVSNGRVFLVSADKEGGKRSLLCFDRKTGKRLWKQEAVYGEKSETHKTNPFGSSTPAADGEKVVVWHSSAGLFCYDFNGQELWKRDLGEFQHMWGYGSSPIIHKGKVFLHAAPGAKVFVAAIDLESGKTLWQRDEPQEGNGERNENNKYMGSWTTPIIAEVAGKQQLICSMATRVNAYDLERGEMIWTCEGLSGKKGDLAYASPLVAGDVCVAFAGFGGPSIGIKLGGKGNVTSENQLWRVEKSPQRIGSGVVVDGYLYLANAGPNTFQCIDPKTGKVLWQERADGPAFWGSMVYAGGHLFVTNQAGITFVIKPNPKKLEVIEKNAINERSNSTPAFSAGQIFLRTFDHLYCIGE